MVRKKNQTVGLEIDCKPCNIIVHYNIIMSKTLMQSQLLLGTERSLYLLVLELQVARNHASSAVS